MIENLVFVAAAALGTLPAIASAQAPSAPKLTIGDPAPAIRVEKWLKGEPVAAFQKDKLYVVEFWATWCGPCKKSIPHLTEMQKTFKDVTFIGVSVFENDPKNVAPFVEKMGEKMDYRVATDSVPEGRKADAGAMAGAWMSASGEKGIPTAFVVNGQGKVAWIGHPMELEEPLKKIVAGTWDVAAAAKERADKAALDAASEELGARLGKLLKAKDFKAAVAAVDEALAANPRLEERFAGAKFNFLLEDKSYDAAYAYGAKIVDGVYKDSAQALNGIAWTIVDPDNDQLEKRDLPLALRAARRANELTGEKDPSILDTLARVYFDSGDAAKAIEIQTKAVEAAKGQDLEKELQGRLDEYKKGKAGVGG